MNLTVLEAAGIDTAEALGRVMGNEALFDRVLGMFLDDPNHDALVAALDAHDTEGAIKASHALKGTCGTLAMAELFKLLETQLALLRGNAFDEAAALMPRIDERYETVCAAIRAAREA